MPKQTTELAAGVYRRRGIALRRDRLRATSATFLSTPASLREQVCAPRNTRSWPNSAGWCDADQQIGRYHGHGSRILAPAASVGPLERDGLVKIGAGPDGRTRSITLTTTGEARLKTASVHWWWRQGIRTSCRRGQCC